MWESCRTMALVGRFSRDLPFSLPFHSGATPYSPRFTFICSQDFAVKSRTNISTPVGPNQLALQAGRKLRRCDNLLLGTPFLQPSARKASLDLREMAVLYMYFPGAGDCQLE
ncbi:hypothetical protein PR048_016719 [Dryococelus australis]|uniref:Uncharacterized protein n=1 Tax=Dryococelus australis TaxID=614101 RepID=A0ABQ9H827_9NEOP|nr:hypothetical protein PR048_016719 [Dryococelus australis]